MKNLLLKVIFIFLLMIILTYTIFYYTDDWLVLNQTLAAIERNIRISQDKILSIKSEIKQIFIENSLAEEIIFSSQKEDFLLFFDFLDDDYNLKDVNYDASEPKITAINNGSFFQVVFTQVSITFRCDSQIKLYMFLDEIIDKTPGYVYINHLNFVKNKGLFNVAVRLNIYSIREK